MLPFTPQLQIITAVCSVLISNPAKGRRLSWPVVLKYFGRLEHFCALLYTSMRMCDSSSSFLARTAMSA